VSSRRKPDSNAPVTPLQAIGRRSDDTTAEECSRCGQPRSGVGGKRDSTAPSSCGLVRQTKKFHRHRPHPGCRYAVVRGTPLACAIGPDWVPTPGLASALGPAPPAFNCARCRRRACLVSVRCVRMVDAKRGAPSREERFRPWSATSNDRLGRWRGLKTGYRATVMLARR